MAVSDGTLRVYEVCSAGPVVIYYTEEKKRRNTADRSSSREAANSLAFQIHHGWQPLLLSTAYCFSRIVCQSRAPVVISSSINVVLKGVDIRVYLLAECKLVGNKAAAKIVETETDECKVPTDRVVNIFAAPVAKKFGDDMEAWISDEMTVYCEGGQRVSYTTSTQATIIRVNNVKK